MVGGENELELEDGDKWMGTGGSPLGVSLGLPPHTSPKLPPPPGSVPHSLSQGLQRRRATGTSTTTGRAAEQQMASNDPGGKSTFGWVVARSRAEGIEGEVDLRVGGGTLKGGRRKG